jgi:hypothetical protein
MSDFLYLGSNPCDEVCVQAGTFDYRNNAMKECRRYKQLLETMFPEWEANGCRFRLHFEHGDPIYIEVVVSYDRTRPESIDFAYNVERNLPEHWNNSYTLAAFVQSGNMDHFQSYKY